LLHLFLFNYQQSSSYIVAVSFIGEGKKKYHLNNELHKGDYIPTNRLNMKIGQKIMWSNMHLHIFCCLNFFHTFEINPLNEINAFISLIPLLFFTCGYFFWYNTICLVEAKVSFMLLYNYIRTSDFFVPESCFVFLRTFSI
jgi:hypothetical protein